MGCKNSKASSVRTVNSGRKRISPMDVTTPQEKTIVVNGNSPPSKKSLKSKPFSRNNSVNGSVDSIMDDRENNDSDRYGSAGSKRSQHSQDSGLGDNNLAHFITENSDPDLVKQVESEFVERDDLDLCVSGSACPRRLSAKDKERQEEQRVLATLREEGLISRPKSRAAGGLAFEITEDNADTFKRPPRLAKLELKRRKKKKVLTEEQIRAKLEKAEERKKQKEAERLARISQLEKNTKASLDSFEHTQKQKEAEQFEEQQKRIEVALDNREKRMKELREKLRLKAEHAEKVRQRKLLNLDLAPDSSNIEGETPQERSDNL